MFCLRSWIPVLFFLYDASPVYLILFLSATYFLNRPCVYCSLLLLLVVVAVFDFRGDWFEPRGYIIHNEISADTSNSSLSTLADGATIVATVLNDATAALIHGAKAELVQRTRSKSSWLGFGLEWVKDVITRRELRIDCMNTVIRL